MREDGAQKVWQEGIHDQSLQGRVMANKGKVEEQLRELAAVHTGFGPSQTPAVV